MMLNNLHLNDILGSLRISLPVDLATFIDAKYYEMRNLTKKADDILICLVSSCHLDLRRWRGGSI